MRFAPRFVSFAVISLLTGAVAITACSDNPAAGIGPEQPPVPVAPAVKLLCAADVQVGTVSCGTDDGSAIGGARANRYGFAGANGQHVTLLGNDVAFNAADSTFAFDLRIVSHIPQPIGTDDGVTLNPHGVRVFIISGPFVTGGSGSISVSEPSTTGLFTAPSQRYHEYEEIIQPGDTSATEKHWIFQLQGNVTTFSFYLAISTNMQWPGLVFAASAADTIPVSGSVGLDAVYVTHLGDTIPIFPLSWASDNASVATVDGSGVVTGVAQGTANVVVGGPGSARPDTVVIVVSDTVPAEVGDTVASKAS